MHFALPPRKTSQPPPFARVHARSASNARRRTLQLLSYVVLSSLTLYLLLRWLSPSRPPPEPSDGIPPDPEILIVTVVDDGLSDEYLRMIRTNRDDYASGHGYKTFYTNTSTYERLISPSPASWSVVPALRHALKLHPTANYIWSLTPHALITNPSLSLYTHILQPLSQLMQKDMPVVPPDSVIRTFPHLTPASTHIIMSQDMDNLAHTSFILRNTPHPTLANHENHKVPSTDPDAGFAEFLLDSWFDPLYRAYSFHLADLHALEHLIQWHPTITAKLVLIPQRRINSYNFATAPRKVTSSDKPGDDGQLREHDSMWAEGDLLVNFKGCAEAKERDCEQEMKGYFKRWEREVEKLDANGKTTAGGAGGQSSSSAGAG